MPADTATHGFTATLSNGTTVAEHHGDWIIIDGERKPFVRLGVYLADNNLRVTSFRYNANGTTYHVPKLDTRFNKGGLAPDFYSLEYIAEWEESNDGQTERLFADIGAFYAEMSVHTIIELGGAQNVYTQVRQNYKPMATVTAGETTN